MRLLELEVNDFRGIRHLSIRPDANNCVIWGPNGAGKSAVVDAIDFLLTGNITRLTGDGTGDITLSRHAPHIDTKPESAWVRGVVRLRGQQVPIALRRSVSHPGELECEPNGVAGLAAVLALASHGHHVLTRREILRYVTSKPAARATDIQTLLRVSEIEHIRKALVAAANLAGKDLKQAENELTQAKAQVTDTLQLKHFVSNDILDTVNKCRRQLHGGSLLALSSATLKIDLAPPTAQSTTALPNPVVVQRSIDNLRAELSIEKRTLRERLDRQLRAAQEKLAQDKSLRDAWRRFELTEIGLSLLNEQDATCPLCDAAWPTGELRVRLQERLAAGHEAQQFQMRINSDAQELASSFNSAVASVRNLVDTARALTTSDDEETLGAWHTRLGELSSALAEPLERYPLEGFDTGSVANLAAPAGAGALLERIAQQLAQQETISPQQTAWDLLTRLEVNLGHVEQREAQYQAAQRIHKRALGLHTEFLKARDRVLGQLYETVKDRFVRLYRELHGMHEGAFAAELRPDGAALDLAVDFHGRGTHPPHALHSEGHQDSMGLCLYLALEEHLTSGALELVILDDVVMSVDADHRRQLCDLLAHQYPDRQFLITTHDRTWAYQLKSNGVVSARSLLEFHSWSIEGGPQVGVMQDLWARIKKDLDKERVPEAAAKLRRGAEQFFGEVCDGLSAPVPFKLDGRAEFGDLVKGAIAQYRKHLGEAKKAASSWNKEELLSRLQEIESTGASVLVRSQAEQWAINPNVHYSRWAEFSSNDFRPVVDAFRDLFHLFLCSSCGGIISVSKQGTNATDVRCTCGEFHWNLVAQQKPRDQIAAA